MKIILALLLLFSLSTGAFCQTSASKIFCIKAGCKTTYSTADTALIYAELTATDGTKGISWSQLSGPSVALGIPILTQINALQSSSAVILGKLKVGTYVFQAVGTSLTGTTGLALDSVIIKQAPRTIVKVVTYYSDSTNVITQ